MIPQVTNKGSHTYTIFSFYYSILLLVIRFCRNADSSCFKRRNSNSNANKSDMINMMNTLCHPYADTKPARNGPIAAPNNNKTNVYINIFFY